VKKFKNMGSDSTARNIIGHGTTIKGDLESNGDFRIDGYLVGSITSNGKIVIGETGSVEGQVKCKQADISGKVDAKLDVAELTVLKSSAQFKGELVTAKIAIEVGAQFSGTCQMRSALKDSKSGADNKT
jgi:cytoskeletal protein CcmA (bactofilin family)